MIDKPLLAGVVALLTFSLMMSYSLSTYAVIHFDYTDFHFFIRQGIAVFIALTAMIVLSKFDPEKSFVPIGMAIFILFFLLMVIMQALPASLVKEVGGAKRWIQLGPISIAPVEFFKIGFVFFLAWSLSRKFGNKAEMGFFEEIRAFTPYLFLFGIAVVLIAVLQKDLGQVVVLGGGLIVLFMFVGSSFKFFMTLFVSGIRAFVALIFAAPHRIARIKSWWGTVQDKILSLLPFEEVQQLRVEATEEPYQISNSLNAIYNGGYIGEGLGNGQFKLGYLSEVHTDFILAGIAEEWGFVGLAFVSLTILFVVFRIFKIASKVQRPIYYLFSIGVGLLIALAFILSAYGISGITPIKGIAVPLLSYGGSHVMAAGFAVGLVLMISKRVPRDAQGRIL